MFTDCKKITATLVSLPLMGPNTIVCKPHK